VNSPAATQRGLVVFGDYSLMHPDRASIDYDSGEGVMLRYAP
jgi:hypothetical protein